MRRSVPGALRRRLGLRRHLRGWIARGRLRRRQRGLRRMLRQSPMHHPFIDRLVAPRGLHLGIALVATVLLWPDAALAQSTIRQPGNRPQYRFEAEPHLLLGVFDPPGFGSGTGFGAGFRGSIEIVPDGFIGSINDSVAIGFGADWVHYEGNDGDARG